MTNERGDAIRRAKRIRAEHGLEMKRRYEEGAYLHEIGAEYGVSQSTVRLAIIENGGDTRKRGYGADPRIQLGEKNSSWRGGTYVDSQGYRLVRISPHDPWIKIARKSRYAAEHRLVMAKAVGRPLRADESVHHIDGNKLNNDLSNLQLRNGKHGNGSCWRCSDCGSVNLEPVKIGGR